MFDLLIASKDREHLKPPNTVSCSTSYRQLCTFFIMMLSENTWIGICCWRAAAGYLPLRVDHGNLPEEFLLWGVLWLGSKKEVVVVG